MSRAAWQRSLLSSVSAIALLLLQGTVMESIAAQLSISAPLTSLPALPAVAPNRSESVREDMPIHLVVKLSKRRVYVYRSDHILASYQIAIGKRGWETPTGSFKVFSKEKNPIFKSFRTGQLTYPGAANPLGVRWIGIWTDGKTQLGFHGTNQEDLLGQAVSHGCIRMRNRDVTALFEQVRLGTPVVVEP